MYDKILVLDFGSQYNQLIVRRIREFNVYSELKDHNITAQEISNISNVKGIILSGGPNSVYEKDSFFCDKEIFKLGIPILGICYGMQLISFYNNGKIERSDKREYGLSHIEVTNSSKLFDNLPNIQNVWMSHGDKVVEVNDDFIITAKTSTCPLAAIENHRDNFYGVQFHPEVQHTEYGNDILKNFVFKVCNTKNNFKMDDYIDYQVKKIRDTVKDEKVLLGLSGGVDSSVAALLINKAIGKNLVCMFIDNGLLRKNEALEVMEVFNDNLKLNIVKIDASERFLNKLKGVVDPEQKRKIIGKEFIDVFNEESAKLGDFKFLAQGTLYTDIIESGTKTAQTIKSHHNVGGLPKDLKFKLVEPLNMLFKDEVRKLGESLGLPDIINYRQPFPGPGLGIRVLGEITKDKLHIVKESDYILREEIKKHNLDKSIWQYFTVLTNVLSVGVMGDQRTYSYTVGIRAVTSVDGMTSDWARIPYEVLDIISRRIVNEVGNVNRIVYDVTSKPPATIEWE